MPRKGEYIPSFDGLRCLAVVFVLLIHGSYGLCRGGWIEVDLFFVLSGFLITSILYEEFHNSGRIHLGNFYIRRVLRLAPPLLIGILLANILWSYTAPGLTADRLWATFGSLFYFANLLSPAVLGPLLHMWSLSVEEHFYLVWPLLAATLLFPLRSRHLLVVLLLAILFAAASRIIAYGMSGPLVFDNGLFTIDAYRFSIYRMGAILMGCLLAVIFFRGQLRVTPKSYDSLCLCLALVLLGLVAIFLDEGNRSWQRGGFIGTDLLCAITVAMAAKLPVQRFLAHPAMRWIGRRSYGIYVYHLPIFLAFESLRRKHDLLNLLLISVLRVGSSLLLAALSFRYMEQPLLRIKRRFEVGKLPARFSN